MYVYVHVYVYVYVYVYVCACVYVFLYSYVYVYVFLFVLFVRMFFMYDVYTSISFIWLSYALLCGICMPFYMAAPAIFIWCFECFIEWHITAMALAMAWPECMHVGMHLHV